MVIFQKKYGFFPKREPESSNMWEVSFERNKRKGEKLTEIDPQIHMIKSFPWKLYKPITSRV